MRRWQHLLEAITDKQPVNGLTHNFYRYPARFSPSFVREIILSFTQPGETVLDPFMGGGTAIVEAVAHGRRAIGTDVSSLAVFLSKAKSTPLSKAELERLARWGDRAVQKMNPRTPTPNYCDHSNYFRNIRDRHTWRTTKLLHIGLDSIEQLTTTNEQRFARCVLLRTGQWAFDCRKEIPSSTEIRHRFQIFLAEMLMGAREFAQVVSTNRFEAPFCLQLSAAELESHPKMKKLGRPKLIITSPPYPGVHVLYHRWQVLGRRETPAPFWLSGTTDGAGASFYTFGDRNQENLQDYYTNARRAFEAISTVAGRETLLVQMIAFCEPSHLPRYLEMMHSSGFTEVQMPNLTNNSDGRTWRTVPNRKWYADLNGKTSGSKEVVLFHKKR